MEKMDFTNKALEFAFTAFAVIAALTLAAAFAFTFLVVIFG